MSLQVTEGKQDLEKALSLSQKFQKESAVLQDWLNTNEAELQQKNGCGDMPADIDAEIAWANVSSCISMWKAFLFLFFEQTFIKKKVCCASFSENKTFQNNRGESVSCQ